MNRIIAGQSLLIICCVFYLIWWSVSFHPEHGDNHTSGIDGILLLITAAFGLGGLALNLIGIRDHAGKGFISGWIILFAGIGIYVLLLIATGLIMHRQVTTELLLIIGWIMLEFASANVAAAEQRMVSVSLVVFCVTTVAAAIASLIFYLLYYQVKPMTGYYFGMVPLITEAISMGIFLAIVI